MLISRVGFCASMHCRPCCSAPRKQNVAPCVIVVKFPNKNVIAVPALVPVPHGRSLKANVIVISLKSANQECKAPSCKPSKSKPVQVIEKSKPIVQKERKEETGPVLNDQLEEAAKDALNTLKEGAEIAVEKIGNAALQGAQVVGNAASNLWNALPEWETVKAELQNAGVKIGDAIDAGVAAAQPGINNAVVDISEDINGVNHGISFAADRAKGVVTNALFHYSRDKDGVKRGIENVKVAKANAENVVKNAIANAEMVGKEGIEKFERSVNHELSKIGLRAKN